MRRMRVARGLAFARAMRAAFRDRFSVYGDPYHYDMPVERLLSKQYRRRPR